MQAIHEALAAWSTRTSGSASGTETSTSDRFSDIFNTIMERQKSGLGGIGGALEMLASQFAGATVKAGTAAESVEAAEKEIEDETGDVVTVEPEVLDNMSADEKFAQKIKDIIAGLLDTNNQSLLNVNGAYVQRSVSISITVVHYGEYHRSQDNGEILAGVDLQTSLQDRLSEMIKKFFGVSDSEDTEESGAAEETKATEKTKASEEEKESSNRLSNFFGASWNLQVHFSQSLLSNLNANSSTGSANASMYQRSPRKRKRFVLRHGPNIGNQHSRSVRAAQGRQECERHSGRDRNRSARDRDAGGGSGSVKPIADTPPFAEKNRPDRHRRERFFHPPAPPPGPC